MTTKGATLPGARLSSYVRATIAVPWHWKCNSQKKKNRSCNEYYVNF